jgi:hypothetical protein
LAHCDDIGLDLDDKSQNECLSYDESVKCVDDDGNEKWHLCCPTAIIYGQNIMGTACREGNQFVEVSWDGVPPEPVCPNVAVMHGTCSATHPDESSSPEPSPSASSSPEESSCTTIVIKKVSDCILDKIDECYENPVLSWESGDYDISSTDTGCSASRTYRCEYKTSGALCPED